MLFCGVDIEDISRFIDKSDKFLNRIFTKNELDYCNKNKFRAPHLAARFCAKEAVIKALNGAGLNSVPYSKIEIQRKGNGSLKVNILKQGYEEYNFSISISHERQKAIAYVIMYKKN